MASELSQEFDFRVNHLKVLLEAHGKLWELSVAADGLDDLVTKHLRILETEYNDVMDGLVDSVEESLELFESLEQLFEDEVLIPEFDLNV